MHSYVHLSIYVNVNMVGSACQCPNDLYTCDLALGCICPEGVDCGLEVIVIWHKSQISPSSF